MIAETMMHARLPEPARELPELPVTLNHDALDQEHRALYDAAHRLLHALPVAKPKYLDELYQEALEHFASEDIELRRFSDASTQCHLDEHQNVLRSIQEVAAVLHGKKHTPAQRHLLADRLARAILQWLPTHIDEMDRGLANSLFKSASGGLPINVFRHKARPRR